MRLKWGTKELRIGSRTIEVRRLVNNDACFPEGDMVEQIEYALNIVVEFGVEVPTRESLGYGPN